MNSEFDFFALMDHPSTPATRKPNFLVKPWESEFVFTVTIGGKRERGTLSFTAAMMHDCLERNSEMFYSQAFNEDDKFCFWIRQNGNTETYSYDTKKEREHHHVMRIIAAYSAFLSVEYSKHYRTLCRVSWVPSGKEAETES